MTTTESKQQYEGAILNQLIQSAKRLVVVERDVSQLKADMSQLKADMVDVKTDLTEVKSFIGDLKTTLNWVKWFLGALSIGILGNLFSQPIFTALHLN